MTAQRKRVGRDEPRLSSVRQALAELLDQAHCLAEHDAMPARRARHRQLAQYLTYRIARRILREAGQ
jgi:hypothetical protein